ncbi:MAG: thiosulfate oxidation carrier protein SoxY [Acidithiobacillus caldus]|nr:thiosulfate oxidation carrier protein SoxY [Acidithiobacillus caldus]
MEGKIMERRKFLKQSLVVSAMVSAGGALLPSLARAANVPGWPAKEFDAKVLDQAMQDSIGKTSVPVSPAVHLTAPTIAENGAAVPVTVDVDHPMTADNYIDAVFLYVDHNPTPMASAFFFSPENGRAYFQERIKMAKTDMVRAVARTNKGELMSSKPQEVKVTIGGCGG